MNRMHPTRTGLMTLLALAVACGTEEPEAAGTPAASTIDSTLTADSVYSAEEEVESSPSIRIYPTLTDHEWYARGEPLQHEGIPYSPSGAPIAAAATEMEAVGEYQGVDYYVRTGQAEPVVYVPVYRGYWQPFSAADTVGRSGG